MKTTKPPSAPVTVYRCGHCKEFSTTAKEAGACCVCKCGKDLVQKERNGRVESLCTRCTLMAAVRYARDNVRRQQSQLVSAERSLADLLVELRTLDGHRA